MLTFDICCSLKGNPGKDVHLPTVKASGKPLLHLERCCGYKINGVGKGGEGLGGLKPHRF